MKFATFKHNFCSVKKIQYKKGDLVKIGCVNPSFAKYSIYFEKFNEDQDTHIWDTCPQFMLDIGPEQV